LDLLSALGERYVAAIAVDLEDAGEVSRMRFGALQFTASSVDIGDHRRIIATPWTIISGVGP
jgi:hypothetical protein